LLEASAGLEALGVATERGLVLLDLAQAQIRAREDPRATLEEAREVLTSHSAFGWIPRADAIEAELGSTPGA
jgi:hypothetical protein